MGSEADSGVSGVEEAQIQRQKKERQKAFDQYNKLNQSSPEGGTAQLPSKSTMSTVKSNIELAQDLESKARESQFKIPGFGSAALNTMTTINYNKQARDLRAGGNAVYTGTGFNREYVGVVKDGLYSGRSGFNPIGRKAGEVTFDSATGTYTSSQMQESNDSSESGNVGASSNVDSQNMTDSTKGGGSVSAAARRGLISQGGGARRRRFI